MEPREENILPALKTAWTGVRAAGRMAGRAAKGAAATVGMAARPTPLPARRRELTRQEVARRGAVAGAVGLAVGTAVVIYALSDGRKPKKKNGNGLPPAKTKPVGRPLCPFDVAAEPADLEGLKVGDFVIVTLSNKPNTLRESTWARVFGFGSGRVNVELVGESRPGVESSLAVVPKSLKTDWHGFHVGQKLFLNAECIWDVMHQNMQPGSILCGSQGAYAFESPPLINRFLMSGFRVRIALSPPGGRVSEPVWAEVVRLSATGSVVTARIADAPQIAQHGFRQGDVVEFARDCVFGVQAV